ncbi:MAG TPA: hypothetical protein VMV46_00645 [Thermoanaerobaculia bacterium]|nr:hypothetical protein [Thermoanaerobaculia bacterium]
MSEDSDVLERLERLVGRAGERLRELQAENGGLRERVATLEREAAARDGDSGAAEVLRTERDELIARVEKLAAGLDQLLAVVES